MSWQDRVRDKLVSAAEAAAQIRPGDRIQVGIVGTPEPRYVCEEVGQRADLRGNGTRIYTHNPRKDLPWWRGEDHDGFEVRTGYLSALSRPAMRNRTIDYDIWSVFFAGKCLEGDRTPDAMKPDVLLTTVSPPDEQGYCSFGDQLWYQRDWARAARLVIAEVNPRFIRTGGDNFIHVSEIDYLVEQPTAATRPSRRRSLPSRRTCPTSTATRPSSCAMPSTRTIPGSWPSTRTSWRSTTPWRWI